MKNYVLCFIRTIDEPVFTPATKNDGDDGANRTILLFNYLKKFYLNLG